MGLWYPKDNVMSLTTYADVRIMRDVKIQEEVRREVLNFLEIDCSKTTDLTSIKFLCTVITKVLLLCAVTTLAPNKLTYGTISSESKWKIEWLNSTS
ncbi:hypothetical protein Tco_0380069 [Tanacetum coccineum]